MTNRLLNAYGAPCDSTEGFARIQDFAKENGIRAAARHFGFSIGTASAIANGSAKITCKRLILWMSKELVSCPVLGSVSADACAKHLAFSKTKTSRYVSNPDKIRLYNTCRGCSRRQYAD